MMLHQEAFDTRADRFPLLHLMLDNRQVLGSCPTLLALDRHSYLISPNPSCDIEFSLTIVISVDMFFLLLAMVLLRSKLPQAQLATWRHL